MKEIYELAAKEFLQRMELDADKAEKYLSTEIEALKKYFPDVNPEEIEEGVSKAIEDLINQSLQSEPDTQQENDVAKTVEDMSCDSPTVEQSVQEEVDSSLTASAEEMVNVTE